MGKFIVLIFEIIRAIADEESNATKRLKCVNYG